MDKKLSLVNNTVVKLICLQLKSFFFPTPALTVFWFKEKPSSRLNQLANCSEIALNVSMNIAVFF